MAPKTLDAIDTTSQSIPKVSQNPLKNRYQLFVNEYLVSQNAAQSARKAGYSATRAKTTGYLLLRKPEIREAIEAFQSKEIALSEAKVTKYINRDITKEEYLTKVQDFLDECGPKHSNSPTYLTIIGKVKGFFADLVQNNLIVYDPNSSDTRASVDDKISALARRLSAKNLDTQK